jgi:octaprenyl-diphosphate synthase
MTLPVVRAVAAADAEERAFWKRAIVKGDQREGDLEHAQALMTRHGSLESTRMTAMAHAARARDALGPLPASEMKSTLSDLAGFVVARIV